MSRHDTTDVTPDAAASRLDQAWRASVDAIVAEADAALDHGRLARQRASIARRIAMRSSGAHARILRFPGAVARTAAIQPWRRWIAAAAVTGLIAGTVAVRFILPHAQAPLSLGRAAEATPPGPRVRPAHLEMSPGDEAFLIEFDAALSGRPGAPLRALDALTPEGR